MTAHIQIAPRVYVLIGWIGGIVATVIGSWLASKIRVYHDSKRSPAFFFGRKLAEKKRIL